jgi:hypothetical protein
VLGMTRMRESGGGISFPIFGPSAILFR